MTISKDMVIGDLIALDQNFAAILMASGMGCVGCPSAQGETLEEAAFVHGMDVEELVGKLNEYQASKEAQDGDPNHKEQRSHVQTFGLCMALSFLHSVEQKR